MPESFYDEAEEERIQTLDMAVMFSRTNNLQGLTSLSYSIDLEDVEGATPADLYPIMEEDVETFSEGLDILEALQIPVSDEMDNVEMTDYASYFEDAPNFWDVKNSLGWYKPMMDFSRAWAVDETKVDETLSRLLRNDADGKYGGGLQGKAARPCPGGLQRTASRPLRCHVVDAERVSFENILELQRYLTSDGMIMNRRSTRLCAKCQRKVATTVKRSRHVGLLPHLGEFTLTDRLALDPTKKTIYQGPKDGKVLVSKTV